MMAPLKNILEDIRRDSTLSHSTYVCPVHSCVMFVTRDGTLTWCGDCAMAHARWKSSARPVGSTSPNDNASDEVGETAELDAVKDFNVEEGVKSSTTQRIEDLEKLSGYRVADLERVIERVDRVVERIQVLENSGLGA